MQHECHSPFEHPPPADVERVFKSVVLPFFAQLVHPAHVKEDTLRSVFMVHRPSPLSSACSEQSWPELQCFIHRFPHNGGTKNMPGGDRQ